MKECRNSNRCCSGIAALLLYGLLMLIVSPAAAAQDISNLNSGNGIEELGPFHLELSGIWDILTDAQGRLLISCSTIDGNALVLRSDADVTTWTLLHDGSGFTTNDRMYDLELTDSQACLLATTQGILRLPPDGSAWETVLSTPVAELHRTPAGGWTAAEASTLYRADAEGLHWTSQTLNLPGDRLHIDEVLELSDGILIGCAGLAVLRSADAGQTWEFVGGPCEGESRVRSLFESSSGLMFAISGGPFGNALMRSADGGLTWSCIPETPFESLTEGAGGILYGRNKQGVWRSANGLTWIDVLRKEELNPSWDSDIPFIISAFTVTADRQMLLGTTRGLFRLAAPSAAREWGSYR